jgi:hypothetical protein
MRGFRQTTFAMVVALMLFGFTVMPAAAVTSKSQLNAKILSLSNMPTGWSINNSGRGANVGCFLPIYRDSHLTFVKVYYADGGSTPELAEELATSRTPSKTYSAAVKRLNACRSATFTDQGQTVKRIFR